MILLLLWHLIVYLLQRVFHIRLLIYLSFIFQFYVFQFYIFQFYIIIFLGMVLVDGTEDGKKGAAGAEEGSGMPKACRYCRYEQANNIHICLHHYMTRLIEM